MSDDLFDYQPAARPAPDAPRILSVSELTRGVREALEDAIGTVWVEGEISNYRKQASGHQYFTLKDAGSQLACVLFAARGSGAWRRQVPLADGLLVQVRGALTVYEARGQYQLNVQLVQAAGAGLLQARFEALKRKLDAEGLFAPGRKRPLPAFPESIALVTSPTGAALRDMLNILARRAPCVRVVIIPARVQGDGAAEEIARGVEQANRLGDFGIEPVDVLIVGRGGGSVEDLWAFNEEIVARAIAASDLPVVSAVGHEIDFTIADFVADLRAPTPSAAAELVVPDCGELARRVAAWRVQLGRSVERVLEQQRSRLAWLARGDLFREPAIRLREAAQRLDMLVESLQANPPRVLEREARRLGEICSRLRHHRPDQQLALFRQRFATLGRQIAESAQRRLQEAQNRFARNRDLLRVLGPEATLGRGYSFTVSRDGKVITSAAQAPAGSLITTHLQHGSLVSEVKPQLDS